MIKLHAFPLVLAAAAVPATAELLHEPIRIPRGSYSVLPYHEDDVERHYSPGEGVYNNLQGPTRYSINNAGRWVGDDLHLAGGGPDPIVVTDLHWVYADDGPGSHTSTIVFFTNTIADAGPLLGNTLTWSLGGITYPVVLQVTGLPQATFGNPGGQWLISLWQLPHFAVPPDLWIGLHSTSTTPGRQGLLAGNAPSRGYSHNLFFSGFPHTAGSTYTTTFFSVTAPVADANLRLAIIPEPAAAGLLVLGGLSVLRRQRKSPLFRA